MKCLYPGLKCADKLNDGSCSSEFCSVMRNDRWDGTQIRIDTPCALTLNFSMYHTIILKCNDMEVALSTVEVECLLKRIDNILSEIREESNEYTVKVEDPNGPFSSGSGDDDWYGDTVWRQTE